jgi:ADP-heptose:LPS heptosyltransferase
MLSHPRSIYIVNFGGIGNGICTLALLRQLELVAPDCVYFHTDNAALRTPALLNWAGIRNFRGTVPASWRRFGREHWDDISTFIRTNAIDVVANLRNEGPGRDTEYFDFKREYAALNVQFWELDQSALLARRRHQLLILDQASLFTSHGLDLSAFDRHWLRAALAEAGVLGPSQMQVGLFTGASQAVKRWPAHCWIQLGELLGRLGRRLVVYAGHGQAEARLAREVAESLGLSSETEPPSLLSGLSLAELTLHLSPLELLISNDTFSVHLAAALGIQTVGLYLATDSAIWGGASDTFEAVQSRSALNCPSIKPDAGNCVYFCGGCEGPCKDEITPQRVFRQSAGKLAGSAHERMLSRTALDLVNY